MSSVAHQIDRKAATTTRGLWRSGFVAVFLSVMLNIFVATVAVHLYGISTEQFVHLQWWRYTLLTVISVIAATVIYSWLIRNEQCKRPVRAFMTLSTIVLAVSFIAPVSLMFMSEGVVVPGVIALMIMHVVPAAVCMITIPEWSYEYQ